MYMSAPVASSRRSSMPSKFHSHCEVCDDGFLNPSCGAHGAFDAAAAGEEEEVEASCACATETFELNLACASAATLPLAATTPRWRHARSRHIGEVGGNCSWPSSLFLVRQKMWEEEDPPHKAGVCVWGTPPPLPTAKIVSKEKKNSCQPGRRCGQLPRARSEL